MAKQISELKQGDEIYAIELNPLRLIMDSLKRYEYLAVHPSSANNHILTMGNKEPIRIHNEKLQIILDQGFYDYNQLKIALADKLENIAKQLRSEANK
jgi:hypothetical protein